MRRIYSVDDIEAHGGRRADRVAGRKSMVVFGERRDESVREMRDGGSISNYPCEDRVDFVPGVR